MILLLTYVALALGVSFVCSVLEAVLLSVTPSYVASESEKGHRGGRLWGQFKTDIDRPLAAILSLNTIAHTVGAAGAGAQAAVVFGEAYFALISAVLTLLILVVSEIVPKTLGALYWRQLAPLCAQVLLGVIWVMYPLVVFAQGLTKLLSRGAPQHSISREEFTALAELGVREGVFSAEEASQVASLMRFRALTAEDVMTPRLVIFSLDDELSVAAALREHGQFPFSRIPLFSGSKDNIHGFIRKDDLLMAAVTQPDTPLADLRRNLLAVPENQPLAVLLRKMVDSRDQIALVVNEYGGVLGLVTVEDLIETLLGLEIVDETDKTIDMQALARELWVKRASRLGLVPEEIIDRANQAVIGSSGSSGSAPKAGAGTQSAAAPSDESGQ